MQAIKTKYLPVTNTKPSRIKASCEAGSITIPFYYDLPIVDLHRLAASKLIQKLKWHVTEIHTGGLKDCYVHVLVFKRREETNLPEFLKDQA